MAEVKEVRETETRDTHADHAHMDARTYKVTQIVWWITGVIEAFLGLRFILRILGANPANAFVSFVYTISDIFLAPFRGIFSPATTEGAEATSVFEPGVLVAMIIYALIAWGIAKLIVILTADR